MSVFAAALDALFADVHLARDGVYTDEGGAPSLVRAILRLAEVASPRPGDRIEIDGEAFLIQGEPVRDRERLVWTVDLRPARN